MLQSRSSGSPPTGSGDSPDKKLRSQVARLLQTHEETSGFRETPAVEVGSVVGETIGNNIQANKADDHGESAFRKFLQPSTRPGWLGWLSHYEIESILGQGAFGILAKAFGESCTGSWRSKCSAQN